jgi:LemA protein
MIILPVALCVLFLWAVSGSNRITRLENVVRESWSDVDVALKRRHDLIPNLVATVKAFAAHEKEVLERVMNARHQAMSGTAADESELSQAVNGLLVMAEGYPDLNSSKNFLLLQEELAQSEDRIAAARRFYNANVRYYNTAIGSFPTNLLAAGKKEKPFYEIETISIRENQTVPV